MADFSRVDDALIAQAVANDDLNDALFEFQNAIGVDDGGVAGIVFSASWEGEWPSASQDRRREMMRHYISAEKNMAGC